MTGHPASASGGASRWQAVARRLLGAPHDHLTGLGSRAALQARAPAVLAQARATGRPVALLVIDIDGFKGYNDTLGHAAGDQILVAVARRLGRAVHPEDLLVRTGGDEFAVLTHVLEDAFEAEQCAQRVVDSLVPPVSVDDLELRVWASVGVATLGAHGGTLEELLAAADQAMYRAKSDGPGQWRLSGGEAGTEAHLQDDRLLRELPGAVRRDELCLHYQPQVSAEDGEIVGFEGLLRWQHPELGLLPPRLFVPLSERTGLLGDLTSWVLDRALDDVRTLRELAPGAHLALNVSARHLMSVGMLDDLGARLCRAGLGPHDVVIEITEPTQGPLAAMTSLSQEAGRRGFALSIHGFGSAQSSLTTLWRLQAVREVKVDPGIVAELAGSEETRRLVRAIVDAAHGLDLRVVGEGVASVDDVRRVRALGCDVLQGFWICPPLALPQLAQWRRGWRGAGDDRIAVGPQVDPRHDR